MQQSSNYDIMANIKSSQHLKLNVPSLKANIAIASKTVTLSSLEILDVSMKIKVLKVKDLGDELNRFCKARNTSLN